MKKYYSSIDKNFVRMNSLAVMLVGLLIPAMMLTNEAYVFESLYATFGFFALMDVMLAMFIISMRLKFYYMPDVEERKLYVGTPKGREEIDMKDVKNVTTQESFVKTYKVGYGNGGVVVVFKNGERLGLSSKKKETDDLCKILRSMMGGNI